MSEQIGRKYNLQPLSPNMVKKAPMSSWASSAHAAGANIGSPAGIVPEGQQGALDARLRATNEQTKLQADQELKKLRLQVFSNRVNNAMQADSSAMQGGTFAAGQEQLDNEKRDPVNMLSELTGLGQAVGGFVGNLERSFAKTDEDGFRILDEDGYAGAASGVMGRIRRGLGTVIPSLAGERETEMQKAASEKRTRDEMAKIADGTAPMSVTLDNASGFAWMSDAHRALLAAGETEGAAMVADMFKRRTAKIKELAGGITSGVRSNMSGAGGNPEAPTNQEAPSGEPIKTKMTNDDGTPFSREQLRAKVPEDMSFDYSKIDSTRISPQAKKYLEEYGEWIDDGLRKEGVSEEALPAMRALSAAMIGAESSGDSTAVSNKGATGLMQLMGPAAQEVGVTDRTDPQQNVVGGTRYFARMWKKFDGNIPQAIAAYNWGPGNMERAGKIPDIKETLGHVYKVSANAGYDFSAQ